MHKLFTIKNSGDKEALFGGISSDAIIIICEFKLDLRREQDCVEINIGGIQPDHNIVNLIVVSGVDHVFDIVFRDLAHDGVGGVVVEGRISSLT